MPNRHPDRSSPHSNEPCNSRIADDYGTVCVSVRYRGNLFRWTNRLIHRNIRPRRTEGREHPRCPLRSAEVRIRTVTTPDLTLWELKLLDLLSFIYYILKNDIIVDSRRIFRNGEVPRGRYRRASSLRTASAPCRRRGTCSGSPEGTCSVTRPCGIRIRSPENYYKERYTTYCFGST